MSIRKGRKEGGEREKNEEREKERDSFHKVARSKRIMTAKGRQQVMLLLNGAEKDLDGAGRGS